MQKAGNRNRRVSILRREEGRDAANEPLERWTVVGKAWASIRFVSGVAAIKAGAEQEIAKASVRLPYRRDVVMGMRITRGADTYVVDAVLPDEERRQHVDLVCRLLSARET
ncbi:head-tail adaptor protein [Achromobacter spanius]|uniref:Head-tail adaptor protein n=2 Tax=Achromobacter spanius TaxID=217203 RepID=A0A2S5GHZ6_9BURK|nr:head-tail adaptor protein [Achromobacter spanius]